MFNNIPLYKSIAEYNQAIRIPLPRYEDFDVRDFAENMQTVRLEMPAFRHNFFQIALLESGGGTVSSDGKAFDLENFSLFFQQPGQIIHWQVPQDWQGYYFSVSETFYTSTVDRFQGLGDFPYLQQYTPAFQLKAGEAEMILEIFQRMNTEYQQPSHYSQPILKSYLGVILSYCLRFYDREVKEAAASDIKLDLAERFKKALRQYGQAVGAGLVTDHKSVSNFAEELAVTSKHLSEVVKKATGQSPIDHINQVLIDEASKLLRTTNMAVKEVGYYLGFASPSYFNRLFKKISGASPAAFRNS